MHNINKYPDTWLVHVGQLTGYMVRGELRCQLLCSMREHAGTTTCLVLSRTRSQSLLPTSRQMSGREAPPQEAPTKGLEAPE